MIGIKHNLYFDSKFGLIMDAKEPQKKKKAKDCFFLENRDNLRDEKLGPRKEYRMSDLPKDQLFMCQQNKVCDCTFMGTNRHT